MDGLTALLCGAIAVLAVVAGVGWYVVMRVTCELHGMSRQLDGRDARGNVRLTVTFRTRALLGLARSFNRVLDAEWEAHVRERRAQRLFQDDLASLSHDIRTPLAGAQGYLELYEAETDPCVRRHYFEAAQERLRAMRVLVDDLFEYAKAVAAPDAEMREVDVFPLVSEVLVSQYPAFVERGWEPEVDFENEGLVAEGDSEMLNRVFANLVVNCLRHGTSAPRVVQRGSRVTFSNGVADAAAIDVERLFERFYRTDRARSGGGSGLGLATAARLCSSVGMAISARVDGDVLSVSVNMGGGA